MGRGEDFLTRSAAICWVVGGLRVGRGWVAGKRALWRAAPIFWAHEWVAGGSWGRFWCEAPQIFGVAGGSRVGGGRVAAGSQSGHRRVVGGSRVCVMGGSRVGRTARFLALGESQVGRRKDFGAKRRSFFGRGWVAGWSRLGRRERFGAQRRFFGLMGGSQVGRGKDFGAKTYFWGRGRVAGGSQAGRTRVAGGSRAGRGWVAGGWVAGGSRGPARPLTTLY
jgi:hypothetical protein